MKKVYIKPGIRTVVMPNLMETPPFQHGSIVNGDTEETEEGLDVEEDDGQGGWGGI